MSEWWPAVWFPIANPAAEISRQICGNFRSECAVGKKVIGVRSATATARILGWGHHVGVGPWGSISTLALFMRDAVLCDHIMVNA